MGDAKSVPPGSPPKGGPGGIPSPIPGPCPHNFVPHGRFHAGRGLARGLLPFLGLEEIRQETMPQRSERRVRSLLGNVLGGLGILLLGGGPGSSAQEGLVASEHEIKAAFLYNFAKFVDWPASAHSSENSAIRVGILGIDPFGDTLDRPLKGRTVQGRPFAIQRSRNLEELKSCHILFVSTSEKDRMKGILAGLQGLPILMVGEVEGFARKGGTINFFLQEKQVRFEINPDAAARAGLKISSKLLQLARIVREEKQP